MTSKSDSTVPSRSPFLGVSNVVRFNYDLFLFSAVVIALCMCLGLTLGSQLARTLAWLCAAVTLGSTVVSLATTWWIYDRSSLYTLAWLEPLLSIRRGHALNIHAGFDETSILLRTRYPDLQIEIADFYDPDRHTERSIRRARAIQPAVVGTKSVSPLQPGLEPGRYAAVFLILALHEIRDHEERVTFLAQLRSALVDGGRIIVVEHSRDFFNFLAYNIGCFHFLSPATLSNSFLKAGLRIVSESRITPFLRVFVLEAA